MTFVARPDTGAIQPSPEPETPIANDGFFPDIDPAKIRAERRVSPSITPPRLREAILGALLTVKRDLADWTAQQKCAGHSSLAQIPADTLDGISELVLLYGRAVGLFAKAELIEVHRDFDTTAAGGKQVDELTETAGDLRRDARYAIRDILDATRTAVDLI